MKLIIKTIRDAMSTPGFSLLYIIGVAFTIAFTLLYGMLLYGQLAAVYPEYDRSATMYLGGATLKGKEYTINSGLSQTFVDEYLRDRLESTDEITVMTGYNPGYPMVQTDGHGPEFHVEARYVEPSFFRFYDYEFKAGSPFTQADFDSRLTVAAISEKVAARLFASPEEAVGKQISIDHVKYRIAGVFREGSALCVDSYGEVFIPYSTMYKDYYQDEWPDKLLGSLRIMIKTKPGMKDALRDEILDITRRINSTDTTAAKFYINSLDTHMSHVLSDNGLYDSENGKEQDHIPGDNHPLAIWGPILTGLLVVLVIPALNISGLIGSRMDRMTSEIGIRRSFGATRTRLMRMVLTENLILTLIGGIAGLATAWIIAASTGGMLLQFTPLEYITEPGFGENTSFVTGEMAFSPAVFLLMLTLCLILNTISAWIPARKAMRRQITESINTKR